MTATPTAVFEAALAKRGVDAEDTAEKDGELMVSYCLSSTSKDPVRDEVACLTNTFVDVFRRYDTVSSLKIFLISPSRKTVSVLRCEEEWAEKSSRALTTIKNLGEGIGFAHAARYEVIASVIQSAEGPYPAKTVNDYFGSQVPVAEDSA